MLDNQFHATNVVFIDGCFRPFGLEYRSDWEKHGNVVDNIHKQNMKRLEPK
jgi:hypothetical protein